MTLERGERFESKEMKGKGERRKKPLQEKKHYTFLWSEGEILTPKVSTGR